MRVGQREKIQYPHTTGTEDTVCFRECRNTTRPDTTLQLLLPCSKYQYIIYGPHRRSHQDALSVATFMGSLLAPSLRYTTDVTTHGSLLQVPQQCQRTTPQQLRSCTAPAEDVEDVTANISNDHVAFRDAEAAEVEGAWRGHHLHRAA
mmetsp:Transcript_31172/g.70450  ORF Transcript_31172/g.70450 Transcript_31172/m.70450 type:complete len:148 (-) Transcript_31172:232-675(-)